MKDVTIHAEVIEIGGEKDLEKGLQKAIDAKDSVGGIVECRVKDCLLVWANHFLIRLNRH